MDWAWVKEHWGRLTTAGVALVTLASFVGAYLAIDVTDWIPVSQRRLSENVQEIKRQLNRSEATSLQNRIEVLIAREENAEDRIEDLDRRKRAEPTAFWIDRRIAEQKKRLEAIQREKIKLEEAKQKVVEGH